MNISTGIFYVQRRNCKMSIRGCVNNAYEIVRCSSSKNKKSKNSKNQEIFSKSDIYVNVRLCGQCKMDAPHQGSQFPNVPYKDLNVPVFVQKSAYFPILSSPNIVSTIQSIRPTHMKISMVRKDGQHLGWQRRSVTLTFASIIFSSAAMSVVLATHLVSDDYLANCWSVDTQIQIQIQIQVQI